MRKQSVLPRNSGLETIEKDPVGGKIGKQSLVLL